ncbi:uncharacterized protein LOC124121910 [Haliotis rufescens]|uniref:uncharacterized protein LOC124121910 n=1 Tax=Haliotis rufescens TaxID=6454 RepID=UPI00201EC1EB|nr:uncharacterized protein LOC124121910 [Haliotis rufescens]
MSVRGTGQISVRLSEDTMATVLSVLFVLITIPHSAAVASTICNAATATLNNDGCHDNAIVKFLMDRILLLSLSVLLVAVCVTMVIALCVGAKERSKEARVVEECPSKSGRRGHANRLDVYEPADNLAYTPDTTCVSGTQIYTNSEYETAPEGQGYKPGYDMYENTTSDRPCLPWKNSSDMYVDMNAPSVGDLQYINTPTADTCNDGLYTIVPSHY